MNTWTLAASWIVLVCWSIVETAGLCEFYSHNLNAAKVARQGRIVYSTLSKSVTVAWGIALIFLSCYTFIGR